MPHDKRIVILALRWSGVIAVLIGLAFAIWIAEDWIDRATKSLCPEGWWHTSAFWAHCSYPPVSISKHAAMYGGYAAAALLLIHIAAPAAKQLASRLLVFALMISPAYHLLLVRFSWVEASKLMAVAFIALIFFALARTKVRLQSTLT